MNKNLSAEETHRLFLINWTETMASLQHDFIYMPWVVNEYSDKGLPGCVGSVDCVHIGWYQCPSQYFHMHTGQEGFPSIAPDEVICISRKFICITNKL